MDFKVIIKLVSDYFFASDQTRKETALKIATAVVTVLTFVVAALQMFIDAVK